MGMEQSLKWKIGQNRNYNGMESQKQGKWNRKAKNLGNRKGSGAWEKMEQKHGKRKYGI